MSTAIDAVAAAAVERQTQRDHPCHSIGAPWVCIYTQPQAERWADQNLRRLGYTCWLPMATVWRRDRVVRSMRHRVSVPLWPRYLLVRFDASQSSWSPIRACPGVVDLVRSGSQVPRIGDTAVEAVRRAVDGAEAFSALGLPGRPRRHPGEAVRLVAGVFEGREAVVLAVGQEMVLVSILMLGALREVLVQHDVLEAREG